MEILGEPNGLLPNSGGLVDRVLDQERWLMAEDRTAELIETIRPNKHSEELRTAVSEYVQRLIRSCFPCQVFQYGSVPLKTYLPDGDIDLTVCSNDPGMKDSWGSKLRIMLENEEKSETAEFSVKDVQHIQAEVKLVKCLVENIVVDISFNQLGGLCTLCFLVEVDNMIGHDHLFKRSIILIKAWCYYESRILGAHHGLISTYALETLVLYIFNVYNNSFFGPLEVLYRFLEFFRNFDWENFCVSLWGPIHVSSLNHEDMAAEPLRTYGGNLILDKTFLESCNVVYAIYPSTSEIRDKSFISKHFNVVDPLRINNNLGRSVSKGSYHRIRSAFTYGAKHLAKLLDCPKENIILELNQFFMNTLKRHGNGQCQNEPSVDLCDLQQDKEDPDDQPVKHRYLSRTQPQKGSTSILCTVNLEADAHNKKDQRSLRTDCLLNNSQGRCQFARTYSSPELFDTSNDILSQGRRNMAAPEIGKNVNRRNFGSEVLGSRSPSSGDDRTSVKHKVSRQSEVVSNSNITFNNHYDKVRDLPSVDETSNVRREEQDMISQWRSGQAHLPMNFTSQHLPLPISPSPLASNGYPQRKFSGVVPPNLSLMEPPWGPKMQYSQGFVSSPVSHYVHNVASASTSEEFMDSGTEKSGLTDVNCRDSDPGSWPEHDVISAVDFDSGSRIFEEQDADHQSTSAACKYIPFSRVRDQRKFARENRELVKEDCTGTIPNQKNRIEVANLRSLPNLNDNSSKKPTSECSENKSSSEKVSKSTKDKRGRKTNKSISSTIHGKGKNGSHYDGSASIDHGFSTDDESGNWDPPVTVINEESERNMRSSQTNLAFRNRQMRNLEITEMSGSDSMLPIPPMLVRNGPRQQLAFYPTGPPVPFVAMLPMCNFSNEQSYREGSKKHFDGESDQSFDSVGSPDPLEVPDKHKSDLLYSHFPFHYNNLRMGQICQLPQLIRPSMHPSSPVGVPPVHMQGQASWDGFGRPNSSNMNPAQLMNHAPHFVQVPPMLPGSQRPPNVYQQYSDEVPKYLGGTGPYFPKMSHRERYTSSKNQRGGNYDRNDHHYQHHGEREWNWNNNLKPRVHGRNQGRNHAEKPSLRSECKVEKHESSSSYFVHNGENGFNHHGSSYNGSINVPHVRYPPMRPVNSSDHNVGYVPVFNEQTEYRSHLPLHTNEEETPELCDDAPPKGLPEQQLRLQGSSALSSPDQPSSPQPERSENKQNYQLKDEDFPPLPLYCLNQEGNGVGKKFNGKLSEYQSFFITPQS